MSSPTTNHSNGSNRLKIYVQFVSKTIALENVAPETTITQLKAAIAGPLDISIEQQTLWTNGRIVNVAGEEQQLIPGGVMISEYNQDRELRTLASYGTKNEQLFYLISKVYIGTPCYGGMTFAGYTSSLLQSQSYLRSLEPPVLLETCFLTNESLITRGRNTVVAKFLSHGGKSMTHLLFIDADISWQPETIEKILRADKDIVGAAYPKKGLDFQKLDGLLPELVIKNADGTPKLDAEGNVQFHKIGAHTGVDMNQDGTAKLDEKGQPILKTSRGNKSLESYLKANLMNYTMNFDTSKQVQNNLLKVKHIGTGFMLIKRRCIEKMIQKFPETKYDDDIGILNADENQFLYNLFTVETHPGSDKRIHLLSEDYLFCKNWIDMGGEIFMEVTSPLTHTGTFTFQGHFLASLRFEKNSQPLLQQILKQEVQLEDTKESLQSDISQYAFNDNTPKTAPQSKNVTVASQQPQPKKSDKSDEQLISSAVAAGDTLRPGVQVVKKLNQSNLSQIRIPKRK